jgi:uncharacterized protein (DUF169 family)
MRKQSQDLSVFRRLELEVPPVGVKFSFLKPEGIAPLGDEYNIALCEMVSRAQKAEDAFYFSRHHKERCVGKIFLGMQDMEPFAESGMIGERLGIFQEARANQNLYQHIYTMGRGTVNYVTFAKLEKLHLTRMCWLSPRRQQRRRSLCGLIHTRRASCTPLRHAGHGLHLVFNLPL